MSLGAAMAAPGPADSPAHGHWRNRKPGQPFFAVFNNMTTHESQIFRSATNRTSFTIRPRPACRRFSPTSRRCAGTGRNITTYSPSRTRSTRPASTNWSRTA